MTFGSGRHYTRCHGNAKSTIFQRIEHGGLEV